MAQFVIEDFRGGLDFRKSIITSKSGTLRQAANVNVSRGGELEKRLAWTPIYSASPNSVGLASNNSALFTFGTDTTAFVAPSIQNIQCLHPAGSKPVRIVDSCTFRGRPFVVLAFANGDVLPFYDGALIAAFYTSGVYAGYIIAGCCTLGAKVYVVANTSLICSESDSATTWGTNVNGSAIFDLSTNYGGAEALTAVRVYINRLAVYSRYNVQIIVADPDPLKTALIQVLPNLGCVAAKSAVPFGDTDNFLLAQSGVRSMRARDISLTAGIYDIGTPIDPLMNAFVRTLDATALASATSAIEPVEGRYLLSIGGQCFVFSYYPESQVSAWTNYVMAPVSAWGTINGSLFARSGNVITQYGGLDGKTFDSDPVYVQLPYLSAGSPGLVKHIKSMDVAATGRWDVSIGLDPNPPYATELVARLDHESFGMGQVPVNGEGTHFGLIFQSQYPGGGSLGQVIIYHDGEEAN